MTNTKFVLGRMNQFFQLIFLKRYFVNVQIDRQIRMFTLSSVISAYLFGCVYRASHRMPNFKILVMPSSTFNMLCDKHLYLEEKVFK